MNKQVPCTVCNGLGRIITLYRNSLGTRPCEECNGIGQVETPVTNADRIRAMSDEELAVFMDRCEMSDIDYAKTFCDMCNGQYECDQCRLDWLKQPAKEDV